MIREPLLIKLDPDSELAHALDHAHALVILDYEGVRYRLSRDEVSVHNDSDAGQPTLTDAADDPILGMIGMWDEGEPTNIARFKDQYIADAAEHRGE